MANKRQEILDSIQIAVNDEQRQFIEEELDTMEIVDGLDGLCIDTFYELWQKHKDNPGFTNDINSWTAYAIGMTNAKPEGEFMPARRAFARASWPDVDSDFDYFRRNEVYQYLIDKYGRENVANIGTYGGLKLKSAVRRIGKVLDIAGSYHISSEAYTTDNEAKVTEIIKSLPMQMGAILKVKGANGEQHSIKTIEDAYEHCRDFRYYIDKHPEMRKHGRNIEGLLSTYGVHAAGIVISGEPLAQIAPLRRAKFVDFATQFANEDLEPIGLIKFDILAISTLTVVDRTLAMIKNNYGIDIDITNLLLDDGPTLALYRSKRLAGVFQCETHAMQGVMGDIGINSFREIMAAIALFRPGPLENIPEYIARKKGEKPVTYFHPTIEPHVKPYLESTYGVLCLAEDTKITMASGERKPIRELEAGDRVISTDLATYRTAIDECHGAGPTRFGDGIKVTLSNGYTVTVTPDHKLLTLSGMREAGSLIAGEDAVGCPERVRSKHGRALDEHAWLGESSDICYLLGLLTGDAQISVGVSLCCGSSEHGDLISGWLSDRLPKLKQHRYYHTRSHYISLSCSELVDWRRIECGNRKTRWHNMLDDLGMKKNCYKKRIPTRIMCSRRKDKAAFLAGLIDSDGRLGPRASSKGYECFYTSCSQFLLDDVCALLQSLGIVHSRREKRVHIYDLDSLRDVIAPYLVLKSFGNDPMPQAIMSGVVSHSVIDDLIGDSQMSMREFAALAGVSRKNLAKNRMFVSEGIARKCGLPPSDIRFYKVVAIERASNIQFYGMSVAANHNLLANGLVASNCYQEQVMQVCKALAGFSVTDGYVVIKGIGKKKQHIIDKYSKQFVQGAVDKGVPLSVAQSYWDKFITPFASYGFNASHSCCYAYLSYICAYLKANYSDEFFCAYLNIESERKKFDKVEVLKRDLGYFNIKVLPNKINESGVHFNIVKKRDVSSGIEKTEIAPSFMCKGVGLSAAESINAKKPFKGLRDFAARTDPKAVDQETVAALFAAGFFNDYKRDYKKQTKRTLTKDELTSRFAGIRDDLKKAAKRGVPSQDMFE